MEKNVCNIIHITGNKKTNKTCKINQQFQTLYSTYLHIVTITNNTLKKAGKSGKWMSLCYAVG